MLKIGNMGCPPRAFLPLALSERDHDEAGTVNRNFPTFSTTLSPGEAGLESCVILVFGSPHTSAVKDVDCRICWWPFYQCHDKFHVSSRHLERHSKFVETGLPKWPRILSLQRVRSANTYRTWKTPGS